jgi:hypothetical protein
MKEFYQNIGDALSMLDGLEKDLNIRHFTPNELKVFIQLLLNLTKLIRVQTLQKLLKFRNVEINRL